MNVSARFNGAFPDFVPSEPVQNRNRLLLRRERCFNGRFGGVALTAHQFDEDIDARIARERERIVMPADFPQIDSAILAPGPRADSRDFDRAPATRHQRLLFGYDQPDHGRTDIA